MTNKAMGVGQVLVWVKESESDLSISEKKKIKYQVDGSHWDHGTKLDKLLEEKNFVH